MLKRLAALLGGQRFHRRRFERQCEHGPVTEKVMTASQILIWPLCQLLLASERFASRDLDPFNAFRYHARDPALERALLCRPRPRL